LRELVNGGPRRSSR